MKKLFLLLIVFSLSNCEIRTKQVQGQEQVTKEFGMQTLVTNYNVNGIEYLVFVVYANNNGGRAIYVVNNTKEQLEIEKLKLEVENLKK